VGLPEDRLSQAADAIGAADALLITAGAGMGVDSGLPDFRGDRGFWRAYPPIGRLGISFVEMANPAWFDRDPELAWGFYGHRLRLYRETVPHRGFEILSRWAQRMPGSAFVFTSNVDGQFQTAGFDPLRVAECHGSIHHLQCTAACRDEIWPADELEVKVNEETFRATGSLPRCQRCDRLVRPNVLMFGDWAWLPARTAEQERVLESWLQQWSGPNLVVIELGAGTAVPTVRMKSERTAFRHGAKLVRINLREAEAPGGQIALSGAALVMLEAIDERLGTAPQRTGVGS